MSLILKTLSLDPFVLPQAEKEKIFTSDIMQAVNWHYQNSFEFKSFCQNQGFSPSKNYNVDEIPFIPVSLFKKIDFLSVPKDSIIKTLYSSSTTGIPSKIMIDQITSDNQRNVANKILSDFLGKIRRHFIVFDSESTIKSINGDLSSRNTAIRGMLPLAKSMSFILDDNLELDINLFDKEISKIKKDESICYFGFTWLAYGIYLKNKNNNEFKKIVARTSGWDKIFLHIGGWKKLQDIAVSKEDFSADMSEFLDLFPSRVIDFYGMTEQLGTVYPDCKEGFKHIPVYSELIIRDLKTLAPVGIGKSGFIQLLSPLPHSYPGISILADDIGKIVGIDDCKCGRKGKYFIFERRSEKAELKGCGDVLKIDL